MGAPSADDSADSRRASAERILAESVGRWRIDSLQTPREEGFSSILDAAVDRRGRIAVLDAQAGELRLLGPGGRQVTVLRVAGGGRREFHQARAITFGPRGELVVLNGLGRVLVYEVRGDSLRFQRSFDLNGDVFDGCILGDRLYVHGMLPGKAGVIHVYTEDGHSLSSFGEVYRSPNSIITHQLSRGHIACFPRAKAILFVPEVLPELRAYNLSGALEWWATIDGFQPPHLTELPDGGSVLRSPGGGFDVTTTLVSAEDRDAAVLQVAHLTGLGPGSTRSHYRTVIVNLTTHSARYVGPGLDRIMAWSPRVVVLARDQPRPVLAFLRARE